MAENKKTENALFLEEMAGIGYEGMQASDYSVPFLRILQALSPEVTEGSDSYVPGAKPGMFMNTLTKKLYGATVKVIPIKYENVWLEWAPNRGGLKGRHQPHSIPVMTDSFGKMKRENGNDVQENMLFYCLILGDFAIGPVILALAKSGLKHGKKWNTLIHLTKLDSGKSAPFFSSVWTLKTVLNKNDQGTWYQIGGKQTTIERDRFITEDEYKSHVGSAYKLLKETTRVNFDLLESSETKEDSADY